MSSHNGKLDIVIGPMFSGKSTALLGKLLIASELGLKVLYINHTFDVRSEHTFSTHHPFLVPKQHDNVDFVSLSSLKGVRKEDYDVIGIDESQFFDEYLYEFCKVHVETYKRYVIVTGLDADANRNKFGHILDLVPIADSIYKLRSYCQECGTRKTKAPFSHKLNQFSDSSNVDVGGKDKYMPLCRACYIRLN